MLITVMILPDIDEANQQEEQSESQLPREYQDYLNRLEQDYISTCSTFALMRSFLLTLAANSANISLCFLAIDFGLGAMSAGLLGIVLGSIPAMIDIGESGINLASEYKVRDISRLVFGISKLLGSVAVSTKATSEYRQLMNNAKESIRSFEYEIKTYEIKVQPTDGLIINLQFQFLLSFSLGLALLSLFLGMLKRRY